MRNKREKEVQGCAIEMMISKGTRYSILWDLLMGIQKDISGLSQTFIQPFLYENND